MEEDKQREKVTSVNFRAPLNTINYVLTQKDNEVVAEAEMTKKEEGDGPSHGCDDLFANVASNKGWGTEGCGLRGGGLNSLGTSGWGAPPSNNSAANATGWGAPPAGGGTGSGGVGGGGSSAVAPPTTPPQNQGGGNPANNNQMGTSQWASTSPNRNTTSQNTNGQPIPIGSQMNSNPSSSLGTMQMPMGNQNMNNTPTTPGLITNTATSSWAQAAGKSLQNNSGNNSTPMNNNNPNNASINSSIGGGGVGGGMQGPPPSSNPTMNNAGQPPLNMQPTGGNPGSAPNPNPSSVTSKQIEQLNNMREALFSHEGWGGNVNQDSSWDIPGSPEPVHKDIAGIQGSGAAAAAAASASAATACFKPTNNGTDLWEANLRNGGAPPPPPAAPQKPWGHTPTSNIGGTWGEEDDPSESSNVWTGIPPNQQQQMPQQPQQQQPPNPSVVGGGGMPGGWGMNPGGPPPPQQQQREPNGGMWPSPVRKENPDWNAGGGGGGGIIGGPRGGPIGGHMGHGDGGNWNGNNGNRMGSDPMIDPNQGMWNKPPQPMPPPPQQNQWNAPPPPQGNMMGGGPGGVGGRKGDGSGWDDVSPPTQRRVISNNYDDGTSLWGNPLPGHQGQPPQQPPGGPRGMPPPQNRMPNKMDGGMGNPMWSGNRQPDAQDFSQPGGGPGWEDKNNMSWGDPMQQQQQQNSWGKPKTPTNTQSGWADDGIVDTTNWGAQPKSSGVSRNLNGFINGNYSKDVNQNNKVIKALISAGIKKEDIELALRSSNMNISDALDTIENLGRPPMDWGGGGPMGGGGGRRPGGSDQDHFDLNNLGGSGPMLGLGHPPPQIRGGSGFPGGGGGNGAGFPGGPGGANSMLNNVGNPPNLGNIPQTLLQKILTQQNPQQNFNAGRVQPTNAAQLKLLVQQIQMAVQAGYLNSQILQHPLPQQSLYLLNQLLQQIKIFQQLTQAQQQIGKTNSTAALQLSVQITKTKQAITNLHNQIAAQQALHAKQQQQQQHHHQIAMAAAITGNSGPGNNDFFKNPPNSGGGGGGGGMDPMMSNFPSDFGLKEPGHQQQSRLNQWTSSKVPSMEKDDSNTEFSRAPGGGGGPPSNSANSLLKSNSSLILGGQSNDTWSTATPRSGSDGWPTDHSAASNSASSNNSAVNLVEEAKNAVNDASWPSDFVVPEFEPGKPWKGTQILKSVEDDPTLTPGSVVRSPLSLATIKDSEIFTKSAIQVTSVPTLSSDSLSTPLSLSSTTWSFTPSGSGSTVPNPQMVGKMNPGGKGGVWDDNSGARRDLWDYSSGGGGGAGGVQQQHRPPPGLPKKGSEFPVTQSQSNVGTSSANVNSFTTYRTQQSNPGSNWGGGGGTNGTAGNFWLLLRNLTPQIDGSTLKTLCIQHGPLQKFHLYLGHGIALVKYNSREEAAKAQKTLNNCVLSNTTILAETASEADVLNIHQGLSGSGLNNSAQNSGYTSGSTNSGAGANNENPWGSALRDSSPLWNSNPWGSSLDAPDRATPSSLNSLIPGDLLGGESA